MDTSMMLSLTSLILFKALMCSALSALSSFAVMAGRLVADHRDYMPSHANRVANN